MRTHFSKSGKFLFLALAFVLAMALLTACGAPQGNPQQSGNEAEESSSSGEQVDTAQKDEFIDAVKNLPSADWTINVQEQEEAELPWTPGETKTEHMQYAPIAIPRLPADAPLFKSCTYLSGEIDPVNGLLYKVEQYGNYILVTDPTGLPAEGSDSYGISYWVVRESGEPIARVRYHRSSGWMTNIKPSAEGEVFFWFSIVEVNAFTPYAKIYISVKDTDGVWKALQINEMNNSLCEGFE